MKANVLDFKVFYKVSFHAACLCAAAFATPAFSIDYNTLENIFGEPVVTSVTGKPMRASEAPVAIEVVTQEDIQRSGARDIPQLLKRYAGVEVYRATFGRADVAIRGYAQPLANRVLVLLNGRQVNLGGFGHTLFERLGIQMEEIRQIEVVKGPNSSLFGFNAQSGVINIITYNPLQDDISAVSASIGTELYRKASFVHTHKFNNENALRISGGYMNAHNYDRSGYIEDANPLNVFALGEEDGLTDRSLNLDYEHKISDDTVIRVQGNYSDGHVDAHRVFSSNIRGRESHEQHQINYQTQLGESLLELEFYRNNTYTGADNEAMLDAFKAEYLFDVDAHHIFRLTGEYRHNEAEGTIYGGQDTVRYTVYSPSIMWDWKITENLNWVNSVRYDLMNYGRTGEISLASYNRYDRSVEEFSFNSGMRYKIDAHQSVRASVGRGLHLPGVIEVGGQQPLGSTISFVGNPELNTERILSAELGYDYNLDAENKLSANIFWQSVDDVFGGIVSSNGPQTLLTYDNLTDSQAWGLELSAEGKLANSHYWGASYTHMLVDDEQNMASDNQIYFENSQPKHQLSAWFGYEGDKWSYETDLHYVSAKTDVVAANFSPIDSIRREKHDGYFMLNGKVAYHVAEDTEVSLTGYNLIEKHRQWGSVSTATGQTGADSLGRTFMLNLSHKF